MNQFLKDILDQPAALQTALDYTLSSVGMADLGRAARMITSARRVVLTSMGSALYSLIPLHHELARVHPAVHLVETAELLAEPLSGSDTLYLILSRSGESGEVAAFSTYLHERGMPVIAVTMTPSSTLARSADLVLHDPVPYDGLICTKAYTTLTLVGLLLASQVSGTLTATLTAGLASSFEWLEDSKETFRKAAAAIDWLNGSLYFLSYGVGDALTLSGRRSGSKKPRGSLRRRCRSRTSCTALLSRWTLGSAEFGSIFLRAPIQKQSLRRHFRMAVAG